MMAHRIARGLPEPLPHGEILLWQGSPAWGSLAIRAFHVRKIAVYFILILAWRCGDGLRAGTPIRTIAADQVTILAIAAVAISIAMLLAWIYARTTTYTVTSRRVFMRYGAALPGMLNIPFQVIGAAAAKVHRDGTADLPLQIVGGDRLAYLHLWPNARPWCLKNPEPMLRCVPDGPRVAAVLASALKSPPPSRAASATTEHAGPDSLHASTESAAA
jgi:Bacterial PH domain